MKHVAIALLGSTALLAACGNDSTPTPDPAATSTTALPPPAPIDTTTATDTPVAADGEGALGLTVAQLRDADLVDASGADLGDVEDVVRGPDGTIESLLVEISDTDPDRFVHVPLAGLTTVQQGDDWDVRANLTRQDLMDLPEVTR